jgi:single-stranded DNA-binding protein
MIVAVISGNLTKDPWVGSTKKGEAMCSFDVAANPGYAPIGQESNAQFFHVLVFNQQVEGCAKYLKKGRTVTVAFRDLRADAYIGKDGKPHGRMSGTASSVEFVGTKPEETEEQSNGSSAPIPEGYVEVDDSELPFE